MSLVLVTLWMNSSLLAQHRQAPLGMFKDLGDELASAEGVHWKSEPKNPLIPYGDTLIVNANAEGGWLTVEALDPDGKVIEGFGTADCAPITADSVRHVVSWKGNPDCHLLQARPIKLRFHLKNAKLFSFEPKIRHNHYLQSYD